MFRMDMAFYMGILVRFLLKSPAKRWMSVCLSSSIDLSSRISTIVNSRLAEEGTRSDFIAVATVLASGPTA